MYIEEEVEDRKKAEYEHRLADELANIREQTAQELEEYKIQIEDAFDVRRNQYVEAIADFCQSKTPAEKIRVSKK